MSAEPRSSASVLVGEGLPRPPTGSEKCLQTLPLVSPRGALASRIGARDAAQHPTRHTTVPVVCHCPAQTSAVLQLRTPVRRAHSQGTAGSLWPWAARTLISILRGDCSGPASLGGRLLAQGGKRPPYLSHQPAEVCTVPGRQPEQRAGAGVQCRAMAHDQGDTPCGRKNTPRSENAGVPSAVGGTTSGCPEALRHPAGGRSGWWQLTSAGGRRAVGKF